MQVSVETLNGLERKVTVSVPAEKVEEEVSLRLRDLARKAKVDGFRPGKVPMHVVKKRYSDSVLQDVAREMVQSTLQEALKEKDLVPAGYPAIEPEQLESGKDFCYSAKFEVFPEISITELDSDDEVEQIQSSVADSDVDAMLENLREQHKDWQEVSRAAKEGDKVTVDFEGFVDGEAFEGGKAEDYDVTIGSGSMIPGFEEGLVGAEAGKQFDLNVQFPEDYSHEALAGKEAVFKTNVKAVKEGKLPELNDELAEKFNIKEGGIEALRKDITQNMKRELERKLGSLNREKAFNKLMEKNSIDIPLALVDREIENLKHEMFHRIFGPDHSDNENIPDFPRAMFEEQAKQRVHLGLLFSEYVKRHEIAVDKARVDALLDKLASAYENPDELRSWYQNDKERMAEVEAMVMEEMAAEKILAGAKISEVNKNYDDVMNPKKESEQQGD